MASLGKRCVAELAGTALLVYFGAGAAAITLMIASGAEIKPPFNIGIGAPGGLGDWFAIGMALAILIAACCFSTVGMLLAVPPTNMPSNIMMLLPLIKFPLVFISGIFVPLEQMPPWGLVLSVLSPLSYFTDLVRYSFTGDHFFPVWTDIAALAVFTLVFTAGTMYLHKRTMPKRM